MQVLDLLNSGSRILKDNKIISHKLDTEIILAKILNKSREEIIINLDFCSKKTESVNVK